MAANNLAAARDDQRVRGQRVSERASDPRSASASWSPLPPILQRSTRPLGLSCRIGRSANTSSAKEVRKEGGDCGDEGDGDSVVATCCRYGTPASCRCTARRACLPQKSKIPFRLLCCLPSLNVRARSSMVARSTNQYLPRPRCSSRKTGSANHHEIKSTLLESPNLRISWKCDWAHQITHWSHQDIFWVV